MERIKIIPPQGKRKHSIIFKATFSKQTKEEKEALDNKTAMLLWSMWLFDEPKSNGRRK